jgi:hypothetical protein
MLVLMMEEAYELFIKMSSGAMLYVPSFRRIGSGIYKLSRVDSHKDRHTNSKAIS